MALTQVSQAMGGTGTSSVAGSLTNTFGFKNRIINGGQVINQRYGTTLQTGASGNVTDRFKVLNSSAGTVNAQTVTTAPAGFTYSTQLTVGTADTVVDVGDSVIFYQPLEGYNIADFNWGTANAKTVTLSFWVYSSLTGTYSGSLVDQAGNYSYPFNYSISSANTWEQKTVTITGPTSGTFGKVNDVGFYLELSLMTGSAYQGTPNAWSVGNFRGTSSQVNWMATSGNTWYVTGVQLEVGTQATSFDFRDYGRELQLCQRYCTVFGTSSLNQSVHFGTGSMYTGTAVNISVALPVSMRTTPTISKTVNGSSVWLQVYIGSSGNNSNSTPEVGENLSVGSNTMRIYCPSSYSGGTAGQAAWCQVMNGAQFVFSSEL